MTVGSASPSRHAVPLAAVRTLLGLQLYVVAAYLAAAVVPYLWAPRDYPPTALWIAPAWLLGVPGFWIALMGAPFMAVIAATALVQLRLRRSVPASLYRWIVAAAVLTVAVAVFMMTPLGRTIATFVAD